MALRSVGVLPCGNCPHPSAAHQLADPYECRINGCPCHGFVSVEDVLHDEPMVSEYPAAVLTTRAPDLYLALIAGAGIAGVVIGFLLRGVA